MRYSNISYFNEEVFKPVLNDTQNLIAFSEIGSFIDCKNCKNYWLIKEEKGKQVINSFCKHDKSKTLFRQEIKTKLTQKCK